MKQWTLSKLGKEYNKAVFCQPDYLTYIQSISSEIPGRMNHKLESRLSGEISSISDMQISMIIVESEEEIKSLLMKVKEESKKAGLKFNIQKMKIITFGPVTSWQIDGEKAETVADFLFLGSRITADGDGRHEIKNTCSLEDRL